MAPIQLKAYQKNHHLTREKRQLSFVTCAKNNLHLWINCLSKLPFFKIRVRFRACFLENG